MYDICCIGHITLDKVVTPQSEVHMAGGTAFYFSAALQNLDASYLLVTSVAESEMHYVDDLAKKGIRIKTYPSAHTVYFENIYGDDPDKRTQHVLQQADAFTTDQFEEIAAGIYHLGPLLSGDIPLDVIRLLAGKGRVSLDVQGYLRRVNNQKVFPIDWTWKREALKYVDILKADEAEMAVLTGHIDVKKGAKMLSDWGVKEVVITYGSMGSVIFSDGIFYKIPAYRPSVVKDATGCGDTYMAGYLYYRSKGNSIERSGHFAAAMAGLKTMSSGPFAGTENDILELLGKTKVVINQ
ncbi:MAG TPA: PfkB family carbohydrate kinase [Mucilaginibacter sp.]|nr:PfkB family carbohydrate kinase [Mucilaginibacter sp.]